MISLLACKTLRFNVVIYNAKFDVTFSKACTPVVMAATAQSEASIYSDAEEVDQALSGLPQSTPLKSRFDHEHLILTSPAETVPRTSHQHLVQTWPYLPRGHSHR